MYQLSQSREKGSEMYSFSLHNLLQAEILHISSHHFKILSITSRLPRNRFWKSALLGVWRTSTPCFCPRLGLRLRLLLFTWDRRSRGQTIKKSRGTHQIDDQQWTLQRTTPAAEPYQRQTCRSSGIGRLEGITILSQNKTVPLPCCTFSFACKRPRLWIYLKPWRIILFTLVSSPDPDVRERVVCGVPVDCSPLFGDLKTFSGGSSSILSTIGTKVWHCATLLNSHVPLACLDSLVSELPFGSSDV